MPAKRKSTKPSDDLFSDEHHPQAVLTAVFFEDDDGFTGFVEEFWSVSVHGRHLNEARSLLTDAAQKFLDDNRDDILQRSEPRESVTRERMVLDIG
jgi:predicted RNase H-like HicB family nuclease